MLQAESLVRSLNGVVRARIAGGPRGIDAIHVVAADDGAARGMAGHVRSALLAGLATPIVPARIHVRVAGDETPERHPPTEPFADESFPEGHCSPRGVRFFEADTAGSELHGGYATQQDLAPATTSRGTTRYEPAPVAPARDLAPVERPRLVAVDVQRPGDGRVLCRVSITWHIRVHRAEASAVDLPGAAAQAAAQAAVRALVAAGADGLELSGLREVEIAGKDYVVVALRRIDPASTRHRSGSAPIIGTAERSAAEAAVDAAAQLM